MSSCPEPKWQPVSQLPLLAFMVDKILFNTYKMSYALNMVSEETDSIEEYDEVANRIVKLCQTQVEYLWFFEEQFERWQAESLTDSQRAEIEQLNISLQHIKCDSEEILHQDMVERSLRKIEWRENGILFTEFAEQSSGYRPASNRDGSCAHGNDKVVAHAPVAIPQAIKRLFKWISVFTLVLGTVIASFFGLVVGLGPVQEPVQEPVAELIMEVDQTEAATNFTFSELIEALEVLERTTDFTWDDVAEASAEQCVEILKALANPENDKKRRDKERKDNESDDNEDLA